MREQNYLYGVPHTDGLPIDLDPASQIVPGVQSAASSTRFGQWQPIETAPKDGSWILAYCPWRKFVGQVRWATWADDPHWTGPYSDGFSSDAEHSIGNPTHWMPLPAPPA